MFPMLRAFAASTLVIMMTWALAAPTEAALIDRGNGLLHDDDLNITWLQDANFAKTSGFDADGVMTWNEAMSFAANLAFAGFDDWRLPAISELGHLRSVEVGNPQNAGVTVFNFPSGFDVIYWSSTEASSTEAWAMRFGDGRQGLLEKDLSGLVPLLGPVLAWPVRDGDVAAPVPEPGTLLLMGSGLAGLGLWGWRRKRMQGDH